MALFANPELVAISWLKLVDGLPVNQIGTTLPSDNTTFTASGFVQVTAIGGVPDKDTFMQTSRIQIDVWAYNTNSSKPPWGKAMHLAMTIKKGIESAPREVELPDGYNDAYVHQVIVMIDPRRILGDEANLARYSFDVEFYWAERVVV